ncbi:PKD domain-containing protein, partial [Algibacter sp. Ld11]|uniref:PKD domain-containing protein n=1 Tax=Algibacter sp. Ld11 TaxID=649150 RepID=UPI00386552CD
MNFNCEIKLANCLKHIVLLCVCAAFLFSSISRAQDQAANWYFGARAGVNFDNNNVSAILNSELSTHEGCASISNAKGELLFYTNGVSVWDKDHKVMPNGTGLMGNISSSQSAIIVPKPNSETVYYIFTIIDYAYTEGLRYSEVDMSLNGGNGDVTLNKNVFLISPGTEKISAVQHSNGIDYWVSTHLWESNSFATFKITKNGVETTPVLSAVGRYHGGASFNVIGCMKFSPNGKKLALTKWSTDSFVELFNFDKETGIISNPVLIDNFFGADYLNGAYGIEFSTDSKLLYVSELNQKDYTSELHQLDLTVFTPTAIKASGALINKEQRLIAGLQLGPDGKIYVSNTFSTFLSVIEAPNTKGIGCNYQNRNIDLKGRSSIFGLPSFIQSFFIGKIEVENVCFNDAVDFNLITSEAIDDVLWEFGDGETSTLLHPDHTYKAVGDYLVKATFKSGNCNYTVSKGFTVYESPIANTVSDYVICKDIGDDGFEIFDLSSKTKEIIGLQSNSIFDVAYFKSYDDATDGVNILNSSYTNTSNFQDIYFKISNTLNPDCYSVSSFKLIIETEKAGVPEDFVLCDDLSNDGKVKVDLSQFEADVYNGSLKTSYSVNYYTSQLDADTGGKSLDPLSFETTSNKQDIFARLENTVTGCYSTSSFKIITNKLPIAGTAGDLILCDDASNDGKATVDLTQFNAAIFNGASQTEHQVTYYTSQAEADFGGTGL